MNGIEEFLDWLVELDIQHYKIKKTPDYNPSGESHFFLFGSGDRFTSEDMINIYENNTTNELNENWLNAIADHITWRNESFKRK